MLQRRPQHGNLMRFQIRIKPGCQFFNPPDLCCIMSAGNSQKTLHGKRNCITVLNLACYQCIDVVFIDPIRLVIVCTAADADTPDKQSAAGIRQNKPDSFCLQLLGCVYDKIFIWQRCWQQTEAVFLRTVLSDLLQTELFC